MDLNLIYREEMLDHVKHPRNMGLMEDATYSKDVINTSCGDKLKIYLKIDKDVITDVKYEASACAVAISSASMLSEQLIGKNVNELAKIKEEDILKNFYNSLTPSRTKCAYLVLESLKDFQSYEKK